MKRIEDITNRVVNLPDKNKANILGFIIGYMDEASSGSTNGYVAFMEGIEYAINLYEDD